jgi:ABC-type Fe3+-hydroxamate transport system substrate-binding protein
VSLPIARLRISSIAIASLALGIHIGVAAAADQAGDIEQQTNVSLAGSTKAHYAEQTGPRDRKVADAAPDAQELARRLLLGSNRSSAAGAQTIKSEVAEATVEPDYEKQRIVYGDPQAAAQQLLLGQHQANHVSAAGDTESAKNPVVYGDAQRAAQQMLLSEHRVSEASPRTARATR